MLRALTDRRGWLATVALLVLLYLIARLSGLRDVVTTDEPFWLGRSANFFEALWHGRLADTFQHAHPGVTTMWAGMAGYLVAAPGYVDVFQTELQTPYNIHLRLREMELRELDVLVAARSAKIVLQAALFAISLVYLRRLCGFPVAVAAGVMVALDPFLVAHDRLLHVDGLLAIASFAATLALADAVVHRRDRAIAWVVAGVLAAVAWLTRSTGLVLVGIAGLVLAIDALRTVPAVPLRTRFVAGARRLSIWLGAAVATTVALWPALWVAPIDTLSFVVRWASGAASGGHELPVWFRGEIHVGDPGVLFYPVAMLWRESIAGTVGIVLFVAVLAIGPARRTVPRHVLVAAGILALFAASYVAGMTLGAKKFDRYILPVFPVLDTIAAIGIVSAIRWAGQWRPAWPSRLIPASLFALVLAQVAALVAVHPYELDAYNPLLGGADSAEDVMQIGWGEGVNRAATFIIEDSGVRPGDEVETPPVIRISGGHAPLLYALPPPYIVEASGFQTAADWAATRYYVATVQQWQRGISGDVIGYLQSYEPVHTVWVEGVEFARVYDLREIPPPPWLMGADSCEWSFGDWLQLEHVIVDSDGMTLWFQTLTKTDLPPEVLVTVRPIPVDSETPLPDDEWSADMAPRSGRGWFTGVTLGVPPELFASGEYLPWVSLADAATGEPIPALGPGQTEVQSAAVVSPECVSIEVEG